MEKDHRRQTRSLEAKLDEEREKNKALTGNQNELNSVRLFTHHLFHFYYF